MNSDFKELFSLLNQFQVRYLVVGGYAVMLYAEPRYTKDIDIFVTDTEEDAVKISQALAEFGFPLSKEAAKELRLPNRMISIGRPPSRIDILNQVTGLDFESVWKRRSVVDVNGVQVAFISLEDLIESKRATSRPQDLLDIEQLQKVKGSGDFSS